MGQEDTMQINKLKEEIELLRQELKLAQQASAAAMSSIKSNHANEIRKVEALAAIKLERRCELLNYQHERDKGQLKKELADEIRKRITLEKQLLELTRDPL